MLLTLFLIILVVMLFIGFPIYLSLLGASLLYIICNPELSMLVAVEKMLNAANSFPLLAVPFFIFAAQIMNNGGVTTRIFNFAQSMVGQFRGGLGYVNVISSIIFSGMSGSALADIGGSGLIEMKAMKDQGYDDDFTIGLTAASSIIGPIIPPSIPFVIFGALADVSIGALFLGGLIPGLLLALVQCIFVYIISKKRNYPASARSSLKEIWYSFKISSLALFTPVVIMGGIWSGLFTPTEAAYVSVLYALLVAIYFYKDLKIKDIPPMMVDVIKMVAPTIVIVVTAALFGWIMVYEKVDQVFLNLLMGITNNKNVVLLIINIILLFMGCFMDVVSSMMIILPIVQPVTVVYGINPVHFGVFMVLNQMIGLLTPPVGSGINMLATVTGKPFDEITRMVAPWLIPLAITLIIIVYVPETVLFLPRLLGFLQ